MRKEIVISCKNIDMSGAAKLITDTLNDKANKDFYWIATFKEQVQRLS